MITRRVFLASAVSAVAGVTPLLPADHPIQQKSPKSKRLSPAKRKFQSDSVEATVSEIKKQIKDPELAALFENCFPNTLDTTVSYQEIDGKPDTFVITGDIHAMWLRDSTAQVWPYLPLATRDHKLKNLLAGVILRQARCILIDPYANAFNFSPTGSEWSKDLTAMKPELHERKWEIDSLCYPIRLAYGYWKETGDKSCFDSTWQKAMAAILKTFREQQRLNGPGPYTFQRMTPRATDTLPGDGLGSPTRPCGLIHSAFRPSDDACIFPFLVPSNLFAVASLHQLAEIYEAVLSDQSFAADCRRLAREVDEAIEEYGKAEHRKFGPVYACEVDGFGNQLFMDDANVPSLLALPYLGCCSIHNPIYQNTRRLVLSSDNPYFFKGKAGEGIGGPHAGQGMIWPLSIIMRALTTRDETEIQYCLKLLKTTHANTGFMHESFSKDDPSKFTRSWFAWANTLFGELILRLCRENRAVLSG